MKPETLDLVRAHFKIPDEIVGNDRTIIEEAIGRGIEDARKQGNFVIPDGEVRINPKNTIEEWGVSGGADGGEMVIDVDMGKITTDIFQKNLSRMVTHELNHNGRNQPIGTLGDALVSEGLAQVAEVAAKHDPAFYSRFADAEERKYFTDFALKHVDDDMEMNRKGNGNSKFDQWFFGTAHKHPQEYTAYGGYKLGYALVSSYMAKRGLSPAEALHIDASDVIAAWKSGEISPNDNIEQNMRKVSELQATFQKNATGAVASAEPASAADIPPPQAQGALTYNHG